MKTYFRKEAPSTSELKKAMLLLWKFIQWFEQNVGVSPEIDAEVRTIKKSYFSIRNRLGV